jgi:hypothetical protein
MWINTRAEQGRAAFKITLASSFLAIYAAFGEKIRKGDWRICEYCA